ncbi:hypothetical protein fh0823_05800 [Francisella halioticida]|uniref:Uncharacterized protein n=1 Tax=Francisella halioticida TaxID=549298 RepID=A0ABN5B2V0_9GAMM|nr:hypothetical protein [Francisella halioticida]ASG68003.1 hypothetical protein CDV26_06055 [Francisella halioticida]BCD90441.1 hypothetical protein fh0823_05800 [Francisella halioticida]
MSIKIVPEKIAKINSHKTRKKITNSTFSSKELISKASHLKITIEVANKELKKINLPYLNETEIVFYSPKKIILQSHREILKSKLKELHDQFVCRLNKNTLFSQLNKIDMIIDYSKPHKGKPKQINKNTKEAIEKLKKELKL